MLVALETHRKMESSMQLWISHLVVISWSQRASKAFFSALFIITIEFVSSSLNSVSTIFQHLEKHTHLDRLELKVGTDQYGSIDMLQIRGACVGSSHVGVTN